MSLFSGTKVEMVQDGEFMRHVHVTVFRNRNGNGLLFDSECPPAAGAQNTQGARIVVARFGPWARELSTPNQSSTVLEVVEVVHLGRSTCHWGLDLTTLERAQRTVVLGAVSTATVGHTVRRLRRVRGCQ